MSRRCQITGWLRVSLLGLACLWNDSAGAESSALSRSTLEAGLQASIQLFRDGKHGAANGAFNELEAVFGRETEFQDGTVQRVILPMRGYAALVAGDAPAAVEHLNRFVEDFDDGTGKGHAFALYSLAQAHQAAGDSDLAIARYDEFITTFPVTPEAGMAHLQMAELQADAGYPAAALETLDAFYASAHPVSLRQQGRMRSVQIAADSDDPERAVRYLLETPWQMEAMPELAVLAFAALPLGDYLLSANRFDEAIAAYRLVPERDALLARQQERLDATRRALSRRSRLSRAADTAIWAEHYRHLISRLEGIVNNLEEMEPYTGPLYLRYGRAFAGAGRHYEAWTVFKELAENPEFPEKLRQEAHYRWIVTVQALSRWSDALDIAWTFVERYPEAPQAPLVLFLNANAHQELGDYAAAVGILTQLLDRYPGHPYFGHWQFTRGFNQLLLEENTAAREDFAVYLEDFPNAALSTNAALWHALAWFFDKAYIQALHELDQLLVTTPGDHYLRPEIEYRRAAVLYAQREYEPALAQVDRYLSRFPEDARRAEALVLRGDVLMGLGRLLEGALAFRQVGPEAQSLFPYAVFQTGKIFRALEDYDRLARHFRDYVERTNLAFHPRVSEALYWIGWAHEQQGKPEDALPVFAEALHRYGNDPAATELSAILTSLHKLHPRLHISAASGKAVTENGDLLAHADFMDWIRTEQERALRTQLLTYYSRLRLYEVQRMKSRRQPEAAQAILVELGDEVPPSMLDAEGLGQVGLARQEAGRESAEEFFEALLARYPDSPQRASAWLGLGRSAFQQKAYSKSAKWLARLIDELPTHPLMPTASLLYGRVLVALGQPEQAVPVLEMVLTLRTARGQPHAEALLILASAAEAELQPARAIAYYQRVYNLYRAYPDLVGSAYLRSAKLFEARGDLRAAWRTYREVLFFEELTDASVRAHAQGELDRLEPLLPPESNTKDEVVETPAPSSKAAGGEA